MEIAETLIFEPILKENVLFLQNKNYENLEKNIFNIIDFIFVFRSKWAILLELS